MSECEGTDLPVDVVATGETPQPTPIQVIGVTDQATTIRTIVNESLVEHGTPQGPSGVTGGE